MADTIDLTGCHFGSLIALTRIVRTGPFLRELWLCQCVCGTTPIVEQHALLGGDITACGTCAHAETVQRASRRMVIDPTATKICNRCQGEPQPLSNFPRRRSICRRCAAVTTAAWKARKKANA